VRATGRRLAPDREPESLTVAQARRIALAAQGFARARPTGRVDVRHLRRVIDRIAVLQLDSVNVLCRSHYLPVFARLGPYPRALLDRMAWGERGRELFEYWGHRASLLPLRLHALQRWRMQAGARHTWDGDIRRWRTSLDPGIEAPWAVIEGMTRLVAERPEHVDEVLAIVAERGPLGAGEVGLAAQRRLQHGGLWNWNDTKVALEWLFCLGTVTTARRGNFERIYDLTERVLPPSTLAAPAPSREDAQRELIRIAARAHGIATDKELRDYFYLPPEEARARIAELVAAEELQIVSVDGLSHRHYLWPSTPRPPRVQARALLSPFDSLIWDRDRMLRLFGFHYRISLYTPAAQRIHGYYVLPFLLGDRLVARIDLKADQRGSALVVPNAHTEGEQPERQVAAELAQELRLMADWLELDRVVVSGEGTLGPALAAGVKAHGRG
jgi:uncharacterized protein YcaQ